MIIVFMNNSNLIKLCGKECDYLICLALVKFCHFLQELFMLSGDGAVVEQVYISKHEG